MIGLHTLSSVILAFNLLEVKVVNENKPIAQQEAHLLSLTQGGVQRAASTTSDEQGRLRFQVSPDLYERVAVSLQFEGIDYFSPIIAANNLPKEPVEISVYSTTEQTDQLKIPDFNLYFRREKTELFVEEHFYIENLESKVVIGPEGPSGRETFRFSVPSRAFNPRYGEGFQQEEIDFEGENIVVRSPLRPGKNHFSLSYSIDKPRHRVDFEKSTSVPMGSLHVSANDPRLEFRGMDFHGGAPKYFQGNISRTYSANLEGSRHFQMSIVGLPWNIAWPQLFPVAMIALCLLTIGFLLKGRFQTVRRISKESLLKELSLLEKMKENQLIDRQDYHFKKFAVLEQLANYYQEGEYEHSGKKA